MRDHITEADKIELFKKFYTDEVQQEITNAVKMPKRMFLSSIIALPCLSIVLGIINPWLLLTLPVALSAPFAFSAMETQRLDKIINRIAPGFTYSDIINMIETGEWRQIAIKVRNAEAAATTANLTNPTTTTTNTVTNTTRNVNSNIVYNEENNISIDGDV